MDPLHVAAHEFARARAVLAGEVEEPVVPAGARMAHAVFALRRADLEFEPESFTLHTHRWRTPTRQMVHLAPLVLAAILQLCGARSVVPTALHTTGRIASPFTRWPARAATVWFVARYHGGFVVQIRPTAPMDHCVDFLAAGGDLPTWVPPERHLAELARPLACRHCGHEAEVWRIGTDTFDCGECRRSFRPPLEALATARFLPRA